MRNNRGKILASIACAVSMTVSAQAQGTPVEGLPQVGKWIVNYSPDGCDLIGVFGTGAEQVTAEFKRTYIGSYFSLQLSGPRFALKAGRADLTLLFGPMKPRKLTGAYGMVGEQAVLSLGLQAFLERATSDEKGKIVSRVAEVDNISVLDGRQALRLNTGAMAKPMQALTTCTDALVRSWGYDPDRLAAMTRGPLPYSHADYWLDTKFLAAEIDGQPASGGGKFRVDVDEEGRVRQCHIMTAGAPPKLIEQTCNQMLRGRFRPALDSNGKPIKAPFFQNVAWKNN